MSEQERPEWAKEFEAEWAVYMSIACRKLTEDIEINIGRNGEMTMDLVRSRDDDCCDREIPLPFTSPEAALRVANCIAKELGGWPGETAPAKEGGDE